MIQWQKLRPRFSLRTLFAVVTLLCIWLGWQAHAVRERAKILQDISTRGALFGTLDSTLPPKQVSYVWRILGARAIDRIELDAGFTDAEHKYIQRYFPEAEVAGCIPDSGFFGWQRPNAKFSTNPYPDSKLSPSLTQSIP